MARHMRSIVLHLLALVAVLLMPIGMTAPAAAAEHHSNAAMPMPHCPEQGSDQQSKGAFAECTMACASALPAVDQVQEQVILWDAPFIAAVLTPALQGLHPDIATPPPKLV
jgi:hypothetical protein